MLCGYKMTIFLACSLLSWKIAIGTSTSRLRKVNKKVQTFFALITSTLKIILHVPWIAQFSCKINASMTNPWKLILKYLPLFLKNFSMKDTWKLVIKCSHSVPIVFFWKIQHEKSVKIYCEVLTFFDRRMSTW